jgi:hypothetical protein
MSPLKYVRMTLWMGLLVLCLTRPASGALPRMQAVIGTMVRVNDYWINNNGFGDNGWARATYYEGDMATCAVHSDGKLGYCQRGATSPEGGQPIGFEDTADFCVGAFLLAGKEVAQMNTATPPGSSRTISLEDISSATTAPPLFFPLL